MLGQGLPVSEKTPTVEELFEKLGIKEPDPNRPPPTLEEALEIERKYIFRWCFNEIGSMVTFGEMSDRQADVALRALKTGIAHPAPPLLPGKEVEALQAYLWTCCYLDICRADYMSDDEKTLALKALHEGFRKAVHGLGRKP